MARIRTIKPEFFTSEDIVSMSPLARLFYVSMWCEADREGRLEWKPGTFKMRYMPGDTCDISELAKELVDRGLMLFYSANGKNYAEIPTFTEHQIINNRESGSTIPAHVPTRGSRVKAEGKEGKEGKGDSTEPQSDSAPPAICLPLVDNTEHPIPRSQVDDWQQSFPAVDVMQELREMRAWCHSKPAQRKTARGVNAFVVRWLGREQDKGGRTLPPRTQQNGLLPGAI